MFKLLNLVSLLYNSISLKHLDFSNQLFNDLLRFNVVLFLSQILLNQVLNLMCQHLRPSLFKLFSVNKTHDGRELNRFGDVCEHGHPMLEAPFVVNHQLFFLVIVVYHVVNYVLFSYTRHCKVTCWQRLIFSSHIFTHLFLDILFDQLLHVFNTKTFINWTTT